MNKLTKVLSVVAVLLVLGAGVYGLYSLDKKVNDTATQTQNIIEYLDLAIHFNVLPTGQVLYAAAQHEASSTAPVATSTAATSTTK